MGLIMRRNLMAAKSGYTAKDYVQDGLVAMWDGIENAGWGVHDPNATTWKDLKGTNDLELLDGKIFGIDCLLLSDGGTKYYDSPFSRVDSYEFCGKYTGGNCLMSVAKNRSIYIKAADEVYATGVNGFNAFNGIEVGRRMTLSFSGLTNDDINITKMYRNIAEQVKTEKRDWWSYEGLCIGGGYAKSATLRATTGEACCIRVYDREISIQVIAANYAVDKARFGLT